MKLPIIRGVIDRRILVNYQVDPDVLASLLPTPFRPRLVHGVGMAGICLIRLKHLRPTFLPGWLGISSENGAHRTAVEWEDQGVIHQGVYVRRRDTNSQFNALTGGRLFPGYHHHAHFSVAEKTDDYRVSFKSNDGETSMLVAGRPTDKLPAACVFRTLTEASEFFEAGALGYSDTPDPSRFQGLELRCRNWKVDPLEVIELRSSFFDDTSIFPPGSIKFDCALLMRNIEHEWHGQADLCCALGQPVQMS